MGLADTKSRSRKADFATRSKRASHSLDKPIFMNPAMFFFKSEKYKSSPKKTIFLTLILGGIFLEGRREGKEV